MRYIAAVIVALGVWTANAEPLPDLEVGECAVLNTDRVCRGGEGWYFIEPDYAVSVAGLASD